MGKSIIEIIITQPIFKVKVDLYIIISYFVVWYVRDAHVVFIQTGSVAVSAVSLEAGIVNRGRGLRGRSRR